MADPSLRQRIWGWYFFDWASQPYHTVLLTFVFGPFFADIAANYYLGVGLSEAASDARAQSIWSLCLTLAGLVVAFGGPIFGAIADTSGRQMPWIVVFSLLYVVGAGLLWFTNPDGSNLTFALFAFVLGFVGAEFALIFTNAQLPGLGSKDEIGRLSGTGFAFGYAGGLIALILVLLLLVEQGNGKTLIGIDPILGLEAGAREGTRFVGVLVAFWFAVFMIPYFLWVREVRDHRLKASVRQALSNLATTIRKAANRPSLASFLGGSMLYRDALNGLYGFGGTYALLVLNWEVTQVGAFGVISVIAAALFSFVGGRFDSAFGPKPVIAVCVVGLVAVCMLVAGMSRDNLFGITLPDGSRLPDILFMVCGVLIGGLGGVLQSASRTLMVRHTDLSAPTESFGLYGLTGRATAFLAPALIGSVTALSGSAQFGVLPLIALFLLGLLLLRWTQANGDVSQ